MFSVSYELTDKVVIPMNSFGMGPLQQTCQADQTEPTPVAIIVIISPRMRHWCSTAIW